MAKIKVKKETYEAVFKRDLGKCVICDSKKALELHHIMGRNFRHLINDVKNCVMLCYECHEEVGKNQKVWRPKLKEYIRRVYEKESR